MNDLQESLIAIISSKFSIDTTPELTRPDAQFGDWTTNIAMQLAGKLKQNPRMIAENIAESLSEQGDYTSVEVAGPGFINITLNNSALLREVYRRPVKRHEGRQVVIETNNPNPFKALHIGHAYNAILADTMANLLAVSGADVKRVSYHGDVGAHVGKSMWALLRYCDGDAGKLGQVPEESRNTFMNEMYAKGSAAAKEDEAAKKEIEQLAAQSFTREDPLYSQVYDTVKAWSFDQIDATMQKIGNVGVERRYLESQADPVGVQTVKDNVPEVFTESNGAIIFEGSNHGSFDNAFVGSNGRGLYAARDIGLIQLKAADYPDMDECIVVTGGEQASYFKGVITAAGLALPKLAGKITNYPTGLVKLTTGKMSSRTGDVVTIEWLFDEFAKAITDRGGEARDEIIAGALRYQLLKVKIGGDVVFDVGEAVSLSGNTGSYLQYAHARARRILEKTEYDFVMPSDIRPEDRALVRKLSEYHSIVDLATKTLEPHHICNYLFELAQEFNRYYEKNQVLAGEHELHRVALVHLYADILRAGLTVLGIHAPESM